MFLPTPDQKIRKEALNTSGSFIIEAPAGSGKTDLLIARYLALLSKVSHPRQILAVTYTRKAAVEMKNRVVQKLNQAKAKEVTPEAPWEALLLSLAKKALQKHSSHPAILFNPESLQIGTFHSFCASLLRGWPVESEIPPGLDLLDDIEQEALLQKAVDQYIKSILSESFSNEERNAYINRLAGVNNYPDALSRQVKELLRRRDRLKDFPLWSSERRSPEFLSSELQRRLEIYAGHYLRQLNHYFTGFEKDWIGLGKALREGGVPFGESFPESVPGQTLQELPEWKRASQVFLTKSKTLRKSLSPKEGFPKDFKKHPSAKFIFELPKDVARLLAFVADWPDPEEDSLGLAALTDILILAGGVVARLQDLIRTQGMDYLELEMAALRALNQADRPSESLIFHHEHLRHILVDEAQDMNDIQIEILGRLAEGWEPGDGRTIFVVGDPKQSIYRFRRAEVGLFYELKDKGLPRSNEAPFPLKPLLLTANFRSRPHLVNFANRLFEKVMSSPRKEYDEVAFSPSEPAREEPGQPIPTTAAIFYNEMDSGEETLSPLAREARWVAVEVARLHRERPEETIAILIPARTHLPMFVRALMKLDVPLQLLEGESMKQRPEVRHLLNLFKAMIRPYDDVAWAGALRAPWFWVSNQTLLDFKDARGFWSERILSRKNASPELTKFCEAIVEAQKMFGRESYSSTLSRLWEDLDGPCQTAALFRAAGVSNARAFFNLLDLCSGMPGEEALLQLNRLLENAYTLPDPKGAFSNVYMMTIHRAKGLEFDHIFAVNLDYNSLRGGWSEQPAYRMERLPGEERHFLVAATPDRRTGQPNLGSYLLKDLSNQRILAEARRLFYVAATRAKESLTLSGRGSPPRDGDDEEFKTPLSSLLKIMKTDEDYFKWLRNPPPSTSVEVEGKLPASHLAPPSFDAELLPYQITSPSRIEDETSQATAPGAEEEEEGYARARGVVIHRILETFAREQSPTQCGAIAVALAREGIPFKEAEEMAGKVMEEALKAWEAPDFLALRESAKEVHAEWALEDFDGRRTVRVGRFDVLLKTEDRWVLLDYKTGQPEKDVNAWLQSQKEHYRPQLNAYAQMVARALNLPEEKIQWAILFTALPRLVWQEKVL
jgi:ATP-dependent exoDNAse (exonuclease V) beta subunit